METIENELLICGYTQSVTDRVITSLILGRKKELDIVYTGFVKQGLEDNKLQHKLLALLLPLAIDKCPLSKYAHTDRKSDIQWVKPLLVCEVALNPKSGDQKFLWLREDRNIDIHLGTYRSGDQEAKVDGM